MGSPENEQGREADEGPQHPVTISRDFYMGKYEITNAQFRVFRPNHNNGDMRGFSLNGDNQPVVNVSWNDAIAFCEWVSEQTGMQIQLPTEAEWEYACRAETTTRRYWGDDLSDDQACAYANVRDQTALQQLAWGSPIFNCEDGSAVTAPVGQFQPNAFGLYDMLGNVWEWCRDWYGSYSPDSQVDPPHPATRRWHPLRPRRRGAARAGRAP